MFKPAEYVVHEGYSYKLLSYKLEPELFVCIAQYEPTYESNKHLPVITKHFTI